MTTSTPTRDHLDPAEHRAWGRALRERCPRRGLGTWIATSRRDPVAILESQEAHRLPFLVPLRHARMLANPFAFYRGSAAVMARDLATTTVTGITTQVCGDAHLANFGMFGSPERALVFDCNDFDETHPGPWEWDVKRLAVSAVLLARQRGWSRKTQHDLARSVGVAYRLSMADFARKGRLAVWYSRLTDEIILDVARDPRNRVELERQFAKARLNDVTKAVARYTEVVGGRRRFVHQPPIVMRLDDSLSWDRAAAMHQTVVGLFAEYLDTLPAHLQVLMGGYELVDVALKVVGVGSVGTRCYIALLQGRDDEDLLILQVKEAERSVLEPHVGDAGFASQGRRVVAGQQLMQAATDQLLGWARVGRHDFYLRQFRDMKRSLNLDKATEQIVDGYLVMCAWTLARAHARSGSRIAIAAYLGKGPNFDESIAAFSHSYADQVALDYAAYAAAAADGRFEVADDVG